jgi:hypothetical protein
MRVAPGLAAALCAAGALTACGARSSLGVIAGRDSASTASGGATVDSGIDAGVVWIDSGARDASLDTAVDAPLEASVDAGTDAAPACPRTWLWTTGCDDRDLVNTLAETADGGMVVGGEYAGSCTFGESLGEARVAKGYSDAFVVKLDCRGEPEWVRTWGGDALSPTSSGWDDDVEAVAVGPDGSIYVAGQYCSTVDFDPGPDVDERTSVACFDGYLTRLTPAGAHVWTRTFGGGGRDRVSGVTVLVDGAIAISGQFEGTVDFDPGPGTALRDSTGEIDVFAANLSAAGELNWVATWGGPWVEYGPVRLDSDSSSASWVTGPFEDSADFEPGLGVDVRSSAGLDDTYVSKIGWDGTREWTETFGGASTEYARDISVNLAFGAVVGFFYGPADFDPSSNTDVHDPVGLYGAFLTHLADDGSYRWTRTWGQASTAVDSLDVVTADAVATTADGTSIVVGTFEGTIDFGAGSDSRIESAAGQTDGYVSAFSESGARQWTWIVGGAEPDGVSSLSAASAGLTVGGQFRGAVEFDLGGSAPSVSAAGDYDGFVARLDPTEFR